MKRVHLLGGVALFVLGLALGLGVNLVTRAKAQDFQGSGARPAEGYAFWSGAGDDAKLGYLAGYLDAEQYYRLVISRVAPLATDPGKKAIADFEDQFPIPTDITIDQLKHGLDIFYTDSDNRGIGLFIANNIVRLRLMGKPAAEIQQQLDLARSAQ